ncbi:MAG: spore germination protein GerW family protein [Clostridia bacterium]|nr:spore germination protein GerW family protein [Clostridia bacterium]
MENEQIKQIVDSAVRNLRSLAEVNTIIGKPMMTVQGDTILPISQVTLAFIAGGGEYGKKKKVKLDNQFAGGTGGGATLSPVGFLVINNDGIKILKTDQQSNLSKIVDVAVDMLKEIGKDKQ